MSFGQSGQSTVQWSGFNSLRNGYKMYWLGNSPVISLMDDRGEKIISWRWPVSPYMYPQYVCIGTEVPRQPLLTGEGSIPSDLIIVMLFLISSNVCLFLHVKEPEIKLEKWNPRNFSVMIPSSKTLRLRLFLNPTGLRPVTIFFKSLKFFSLEFQSFLIIHSSEQSHKCNII